jgi:hypothetical protein
MSSIHRTLVVNPVEPAPISMKLRSGLENTVEIEYLRQNGAPYNTDFGAQMYLIERTTGSVRAYILPSIDVINGRAQAYIPAGDIKDRNGYNVQIIGTVEGEPRLIARGSASVYETEALGVIPVDLIDMVDITIAYGLGASIDVALWRDVNKATPYAVMPPPVTAYVWTAMAGTVLAAFAAEKIDTNVVRLTLTEGQVASLPAKCWWSLSVTESGGLTTLVQGDVLVTGTPLPVFTTITAPYNYLKQATLGTPASGEALHCTNAPDLLRVSMFDNDGVDQSVYLSRVEAGSTITLLTPPPPPPTPGPPDPLPEALPHTMVLPRDTPPPTPGPPGTTWTVVSVDRSDTLNYFGYVITPATQSPETGIQSFVFSRG